MLCPRDQTELKIEHTHKIEVDHCPTCNGRWLDHHELDLLEAVRATEEERKATIEYSKRESELNCPVCGKQMLAFNSRAYDLELDTPSSAPASVPPPSSAASKTARPLPPSHNLPPPKHWSPGPTKDSLRSR